MQSSHQKSYQLLPTLSVSNISIVLNQPFSRVALSPLVNIYLLEEFSFSLESRCCFFSLESTLLPCRYPLPGKGASASHFPIPLRSVSLCRMASMYPNVTGTSWPSSQFFLWDVPPPEQILTQYYVLLCGESERPPCLDKDRELILVPAWWGTWSLHGFPSQLLVLLLPLPDPQGSPRVPPVPLAGWKCHTSL